MSVMLTYGVCICLIDVCDDGATFIFVAVLTLIDPACQRHFDKIQMPPCLLDLCQAHLCQFAYAVFITGLIGEGEQGGDVGEGEGQLLCTFDEVDAGDDGVIITRVTFEWFDGFGQQTARLVVADGFNVHASGFGELTNGEGGGSAVHCA